MHLLLSSQSHERACVDDDQITHYGEYVQEPTKIPLGKDDEGRRADRVVRKVLKSVPLSTVYRLFRQKRVRIGQRTVEADERIKSGDVLNLFLPESIAIDAAMDSRSERFRSFDTTLLTKLSDQPRVLWENEHLLAVHKPRGMLTHDGPSCLDAFIRNYLTGRVPFSASFNQGPLHRLDRNTSGVIMFSKSRIGAEIFSRELISHRIRKFYIVIAHGRIEDEVVLQNKLGRDQRLRRTIVDERGSTAKLRIIPLAVKEDQTLAIIELYTGLTHQIRSQLSIYGHPLTGDIKYGNNAKLNPDGYFLHAFSLAVLDFASLNMPKVLYDPLPPDFNKYAIEMLKSGFAKDKHLSMKSTVQNSISFDESILKIIEDML